MFATIKLGAVAGVMMGALSLVPSPIGLAVFWAAASLHAVLEATMARAGCLGLALLPTYSGYAEQVGVPHTASVVGSL
jgi:hypothetical protein